MALLDLRKTKVYMSNAIAKLHRLGSAVLWKIIFKVFVGMGLLGLLSCHSTSRTERSGLMISRTSSLLKLADTSFMTPIFTAVFSRVKASRLLPKKVFPLMKELVSAADLKKIIKNL